MLSDVIKHSSRTLPEVDIEVRDFAFYYFLGIFHATFCKIYALFLAVLMQCAVRVHVLSLSSLVRGLVFQQLFVDAFVSASHSEADEFLQGYVP